ncbi:MAG: hypothetical protein CFE21_05490 [Bacteroidetes bacterium B1(2017)]|nr:MAG: hypothetical protein CFE21_05490 [Bacteroidetes bacterium B1(2017)]
MFYFLSKVLYALVAPVSIIIILMLIYAFTRIKSYFYWALGLLIFFTNPFFAQVIMGWYEVAPVVIKKDQKYDAIILPGGFVTNYEIEGQLRVNFSDGNDRMMQAIDLFKRGVSKKIIYTAGSDTIFGAFRAEAEMGRLFLLKCGIPDSCIIIETKSINTYQNAAFTQKLLAKIDPNYASKKYLLVTAGFHMRRAKACFEKAGIPCDTYSTDLRSIRNKDSVLNTIIPTYGGLQNWTILLKEWIGMVVYEMKGYV